MAILLYLNVNFGRVAYLICTPARTTTRYAGVPVWCSFADAKRATFAQERLWCGKGARGSINQWAIFEVATLIEGM
jgi:hypothetical protein